MSDIFWSTQVFEHHVLERHVAAAARRPRGPAPYSGSAPARLLLARARALPVIVALVAALASGGCSYQLGAMFERSKIEADVAHTGSIRKDDSPAQGELPPETDLAYARAAAAEVLGRSGGEASVPWENPHTGARGTVTPIASAYTQDGHHCRDFLASHVRQGSETWLQGEACRKAQGPWEVRNFRRWKQS